jgi:hypothetical protein
VTAAVKTPEAAGLNVTLMVQLAFAATLEPQLLLCAKSAASAPVSAMLEMLREALPVLLRVTDFAALVEPTVSLPKLRLVAERLAADAAPVPVRLTPWGLPVALSATLRVAVNVPPAAGVKVRLIVQAAPAATVDPQLLVCAKSVALVPDSEMLLTLKAAVPELLRVTV